MWCLVKTPQYKTHPGENALGQNALNKNAIWTGAEGSGLWSRVIFLGKAMGGHMPMAQCFTIVQTTVR